jgi:hypothetical protein
MSSSLPNIGKLDRIKIFFETKQLGKSWLRVNSFDEKDAYFEFERSNLGAETIEHGNVYKESTGTFAVDEDDASDLDDVRSAYNKSTLVGTKPNVTIVRETSNGNGTVSTTKYLRCTLDFSRTNKEFGSKVERSFSWKGINAHKVRG